MEIRRSGEWKRRDSHGGGASGFWRLRDERWERVSEKNERKKEEESLVKNIKYERWENLFYFMV